MGTGGESFHPNLRTMTSTLTALHVDDSVNTCDCCGRTDLKATVLMQDTETGALLNFGRVCAARNSGKTSQQLTKEVRAHRHACIGRAGNELMATRRQGQLLTKAVIREVAARQCVDADGLAILLRVWS
jgi:hypothetical protein